MNQVLIAGAGPTGLMLAAELAIAGVDAVIVERRESQDFVGSRALGLHARSLEVLDQRGVAERFIAQGTRYPVSGFAMIQLPLGDLPTRHAYTLGLPQQKTEYILAGWVAERGVPILRGCEMTGFAQDEDGVSVTLSDGRTLRAQYLVGCDGGRSLVRKTAGIAFPGWEPSTSFLIAEARMGREPAWGMRHDEKGLRGIGKLEDPTRVRIVIEQPVADRGEPTIDDVRAALADAYGDDFGVHDATWVSRFTDAVRHAAAYRDRRVLIAGDAAHVHSPVGGQGLDTGLGDAANLGWKLAQVVRGASPEALLDSYHAERHPVAARVLRTTMAQTALRRGDVRTKVAHELFADLLKLDEPRRRYAAMVSGLDIRYDLGEGHPLLGLRAPDVDLETPDGPRRLYALLHDARHLLVSFGGALAAPEHVRYVEARCAAAWELPVIGSVPAPAAMLVRPDGHVAWVGDGTDRGLADAVARWCGHFGGASRANVSASVHRS